jgi:hypothetical protein
MATPLWPFDKLSWYARSEDPEVRYWAVERLIRSYPDRAPEACAMLILDEHDTTPELVAENLRDFGREEHIPLLLRAFKQMRGLVAGRAFEALARIGAPDLPGLARSAASRPELTEGSLALIVETLADLHAEGNEDAALAIADITAQKGEILAEPGALKGALDTARSTELPALFASFARALQWKGLGRSADLLRVVTDHLEVDDCSWCVRTGPDGRIDLRKTITSAESGYDCELEGARPAIPPDMTRDLAMTFRSKDLSAAITALHAALAGNLAALRSPRPEPPKRAAGAAPADSLDAEAAEAAEPPRSAPDREDPLPERMAAVAAALVAPQFRAEADRLGPVFQHGLATVLRSCLFKVARYRNYALEVERAGRHLEPLLALAEEETAFLLDSLPQAIADAAAKGPAARRAARREEVLQWCRRMLEARGPFFPKALALETIGLMQAEDHVPELLDALLDENSFVFTSAEKGLKRMGEAVLGPARARLQAGAMEHESLHSLLIILVEMGDQAALALLLDHFDDFIEGVGAGEVAEWTALLGARELFEPLHRHLLQDMPRVGQALLLLGSIHNIPVPEESQIQAAIDDYWRRHPPSDAPGGGGEDDSGPYVM